MLGTRNKRPVLQKDRPCRSQTGKGLRAGSPDLAAMLELLDLRHRKSSRPRTGCGTVGHKCHWVLALGGAKLAGAVVAPEVPIQPDGVKTARNISPGKVEAVSGHRAQD